MPKVPLKIRAEWLHPGDFVQPPGYTVYDLLVATEYNVAAKMVTLTFRHTGRHSFAYGIELSYTTT